MCGIVGALNWVAGGISPSAPATPPCMRVRTGRFISAEQVIPLRHTHGPSSTGHEQTPTPVSPTTRWSSGLRRQRLRQVPVAFATQPGENGVALPRPQPEEFADPRAWAAPLFPVAHPNPPPNPPLQLGNGPVILRDAKVMHPALKDTTLAELLPRPYDLTRSHSTLGSGSMKIACPLICAQCVRDSFRCLVRDRTAARAAVYYANQLVTT